MQTPAVIDLTSEPYTIETSSTGTCKKKVDMCDICLTTVDQGVQQCGWQTTFLLKAKGYCRGKLVHMFFNLLALGRCVPLMSISSRLSTMDMPIGLWMVQWMFMTAYIYMRVSSCVKEQVAAIVHTDKKGSLWTSSMFRCRVTYDCVLFSLAFATCLANECCQRSNSLIKAKWEITCASVCRSESWPSSPLWNREHSRMLSEQWTQYLSFAKAECWKTAA